MKKYMYAIHLRCADTVFPCVCVLHISALPFCGVPSLPLGAGAQVVFRGHDLTDRNAVCC